VEAISGLTTLRRSSALPMAHREFVFRHAQTLRMPSTQKLPILATAARTYRAVFRELGSIYRASWPWLVALTPVAGYLAFFEARNATSEVALVKFIWSSLSNLAIISLAVAWQRYIVIGTPLRLVGSNLRDRSLWNYVGVGLKIGLLTIFPAGIAIIAVSFTLSQMLGVARPMDMPAPYLISTVLFDVFVGVLAFAFVFRLSPLLPARAADDLQCSFRSVWNRTRGNTWRLAMTSLLCAMPPYMFVMLALGVLTSIGLYFAGDDPSGPSEWSPHIFAVVAMVATSLNPIAVCLAFGAVAGTYNHFIRAERHDGLASEMSSEARLRLEHRW
jgi:hypothetical protein